MNIPVPFPLLWLGKNSQVSEALKVQVAPWRCSKRAVLVGEKAVTKDHGPSVGGSTMDLRFVEASGVKSMQLFACFWWLKTQGVFLLNQWGNKQQVVEECGRSHIDHVNFLSGTLTVDRWPLTDLLRRDSSRFNARFSLERCRKGYSYRSG